MSTSFRSYKINAAMGIISGVMRLGGGVKMFFYIAERASDGEVLIWSQGSPLVHDHDKRVLALGRLAMMRLSSEAPTETISDDDRMAEEECHRQYLDGLFDLARSAIGVPAGCPVKIPNDPAPQYVESAFREFEWMIHGCDARLIRLTPAEQERLAGEARRPDPTQIVERILQHQQLAAGA